MGLMQSLKSLAMRFPGWGGSSGGVWRTYDSFSAWDSAYYQTLGLSSGDEPDYAGDVGDPLSSSLVMAAVRWVGNTLPEAQIQVREPQPEGEPVEVPNHALVNLLRRPNPFYSGSVLWKAFACSWVTSGNCYFVKARGSETGSTRELWYVPHYQLEPKWPSDGSTFISHYELDVDGRKTRVETGDVIHFRDGIDPANMRKGLSPLYSLWRELYGDAQAARYSARVTRNFGVPPFALSPKPDQSGVDVDVEKIKAALMRQITGANTGKPLVLSSAFDVHQFSAKPSEMNTETSHRIPEERVAAVIGIPAMVLGFGAGLERSTFSNMEQAHEYAYESYLIPLQRYIAEELNHQLLPEMEARRDRFVYHDLSNVRALQEDMTALYAREALAYEKGIKMRSEVRSRLGLKSGPEDDVYYVQPASTVVDAEDGPDENGLPPGDEESDTEDADTEAVKSVPPKEEVEAVVEWWDKVAPSGAGGILNAKVSKNGNHA